MWNLPRSKIIVNFLIQLIGSFLIYYVRIIYPPVESYILPPTLSCINFLRTAK